MLKGGYHAEESMTMLAGVGRLLYESIAGIQEPPFYGTRQFGPAYGRFHIKPYPLGDLKYAEASIKTVRGIVSSSWRRTKDSFVLDIEIPVGSTAKVSVPTLGLKELAVDEGGISVWKNDVYIDGVAGIAGARRDTDWVTFDVGSGSYRFELQGKQRDATRSQDDKTHARTGRPCRESRPRLPPVLNCERPCVSLLIHGKVILVELEIS